MIRFISEELSLYMYIHVAMDYSKFNLIALNGRYYFGATPVIVLSDQELLKQVMVKQFDCFTDRQVNVVWKRIMF